MVVTIVVLLILAGISLNLVLGQNGIISRAQDARNQTAEGQVNTEKAVNALTDEMEDLISENENSGNGSNTGNGGNSGGGSSGGSSSSGSTVDGVPIPSGFVYVGGTKDSGLVISDNAADKERYKGQTTVGTDLKGNQFVWIPVENIADYKRTAYAADILSRYSETLADDEKTSVETNKGFYIGRYEAGDQESTNSNALRTSSSSTSNTVTIRAGQAPYNYVTRTQAKSLAEAFSTKQGYTSVKSKLVSSYAWDTAIAFIQKTNRDYGKSSEEGNYEDSSTFTYTGIADTEKNKQTKVYETATLIPTGQTTAVNNIYDMGGNVWEWTTECYSDTSYPYTYRGGYYSFNFANVPAGDRGNGSDNAVDGIGFRCTLYL